MNHYRMFMLAVILTMAGLVFGHRWSFIDVLIITTTLTLATSEFIRLDRFPSAILAALWIGIHVMELSKGGNQSIMAIAACLLWAAAMVIRPDRPACQHDPIVPWWELKSKAPESLQHDEAKQALQDQVDPALLRQLMQDGNFGGPLKTKEHRGIPTCRHNNGLGCGMFRKQEEPS